MTKRVTGPTQAFLRRLIRAGRQEGLPNLVYQDGGVAIVIPLDGSYVDKLSTGQPSAPDTEEVQREPHNWKSW